MEGSFPKKISILIFIFLASLTSFVLSQNTRLDFYKTTCPKVEFIVKSAVKAGVQSNPRVAPGLLRMFFHDCFVNGCDASILIDGPSSEKTAIPNVPLQGFEVIDAAKSQLEAICPGVVSCADILALAARDSVVLSGGIYWEVPTGRRDGLVSQASDVANLPAPNDPISVQIRKFADKKLNIQDLVTLVGGHTIGTAGCAVISYRLYNFNNTNGPDPDINPAFLPKLRALCPNGGDGSTRVGLDTGSITHFDDSYYENLRKGQGVLESDSKLWSDPTTQKFVQRYLRFGGILGIRFNIEFGKSMVKMGNIEVKTGLEGQIRKVCTTIN